MNTQHQQQQLQVISNIQPINPSKTVQLSPFTWTHIQLPQLSNKNSHSKDHNSKSISLQISHKNTISKQQRYPIIKQKQIARNKNHSTLENKNATTQLPGIHTKARQHQTIDAKNNNKKRTSFSNYQQQQSSSNKKQLKTMDQSPKNLTQDQIGHRNINHLPYKRMKFRPIIDTTDPHKNYIKVYLGQIVQKSFIGSPPTYIKEALLEIGWHCADEKTFKETPHLIWIPNDTINYYNNLQPKQLLNHIQGSHHLTLKSLLHEQQSGMGANSYPLSFCFPQQSAWFIIEYQNSIVKSHLQKIIKCIESRAQKEVESRAQKEGEQITNKFNIVEPLEVVSLGSLMPTILPTDDQNILTAISLCLYLQKYIKDRQIRYFQEMSVYKPIKVCPNQKLTRSLIKTILDIDKNGQLVVFLQRLPSNLLTLLIHYHRALTHNDETYQAFGINNLWLVKPNYASQGKGISFFQPKDYIETLSNTNPKIQIQQWNVQLRSFKIKSKYNNKIIQKYIEKPFLITKENTPQNKKDKINKYYHRKFDIRQWVLVVSCNNKPKIYRFCDGYLRFCSFKYDNTSYQMEKHLTNYTLNKNSEPNNQYSVLTIREFFQHYPQLQSHFYTQLDFLIINSIFKNDQLHYQDGCFQLFGYDVLMDQNNKLWLLEINSIPACQTSRYQALKQMSKIMVKQMMEIVNSNEGYLQSAYKQDSNHWIQIYPLVVKQRKNYPKITDKNQFNTINSKISLINILTKRNNAIEMMKEVYLKIMMRYTFNKIRQQTISNQQSVENVTNVENVKNVENKDSKDNNIITQQKIKEDNEPKNCEVINTNQQFKKQQKLNNELRNNQQKRSMKNSLQAQQNCCLNQ